MAAVRSTGRLVDRLDNENAAEIIGYWKTSEDILALKATDKQKAPGFMRQVLNDPVRPPHYPVSYWCDCAESNIAYYGNIPVRSSRDPSANAAYSLVPTQLDEGTADICLHCGYTAMAKRVELPSKPQNKFARNSLKSSRARALVCKDLASGKETEYPSIEAATKAGFTSVKYALRAQIPCRQMNKKTMWRYKDGNKATKYVYRNKKLTK